MTLTTDVVFRAQDPPPQHLRPQGPATQDVAIVVDVDLMIMMGEHDRSNYPDRWAGVGGVSKEFGRSWRTIWVVYYGCIDC